MNYATRFEQFPTLLAYAEKASEIGPLIACAKSSGVQAVPRTGGHQYVHSSTRIASK